MGTAESELLQLATRKAHGAESTYMHGVRVWLRNWDGEVYLFRLLNHPVTRECYGWAEQNHKKGLQYVAILRKPPSLQPTEPSCPTVRIGRKASGGDFATIAV
jgi:hypothetical protein